MSATSLLGSFNSPNYYLASFPEYPMKNFTPKFGNDLCSRKSVNYRPEKLRKFNTEKFVYSIIKILVNSTLDTV